MTNATPTHANGHAADIARGYIARGWAPIPVPARSKRPILDGWEQLRISESELPRYFRADCNIGVLNGEPSGWVVDVDLDHDLARQLADDFLPPTQAQFGRASARRSHRLYRVNGPVETLQLRLPKVNGKAPMIVELRSNGSQTIFPGSVHEEGEPIEWDIEGEPDIVAPGLLVAAVTALADEVKKQLGLLRNGAPSNGATRTGRATKPASNANDRARKYLAKIPPAVSGQGGHDQTFHAACVLVQGFALDRGPAFELLREWNQTCEPPWSDRELEHKIGDAFEQPGERGYLLNGEAPRHAHDGAPRPSAIRNASDTGNAERFADQHGENVRYSHKWNKWLIWDGRRWAEDTTGEVMRLTKRTVRSIYAEASEATDKSQREALAKWAAASERRERRTAMLALAQSEQPIPVEVESLDADPWLFNVENGTLDLHTGQLRSHRRDDFLTKLCSLEYPTESGCDPELWLNFLDRIFAGNGRLVKFMQRLVGMTLVGEILENILPIFHGVGANGKSVTLETLCGVLGPDYAMTASTSLLMVDHTGRHPTERTDLYGKRLVAANESGDGGRLSEETVKQLTSRERIRARRMREDNWEFTPSHTVVLATNHKPEIRGVDYGIWRRIHLIPFSVTIPPGERDKDLANKLRAEWPSILRWAVAGCLDWQRNGLQAPPEVLDATDDYRAEQDILGEWVEECCVVGPGCEARSADLYRSYRKWAEDRAERPFTQTRFGVRLAERGFTKARQSSGHVAYRGVGLPPKGGSDGES